MTKKKQPEQEPAGPAVHLPRLAKLDKLDRRLDKVQRRLEKIFQEVRKARESLDKYTKAGGAS